MRSNLHRVVAAMAVLAVILLAARPASALLVAEWDFQAGTNLSANLAGTNNISDTRVGAHSAAANAGINNLPYQDRVRFGSFHPPFSTTNSPYTPANTPGLSTTGSNGEWQDYMGGTGYQSGSVVSVFKPNFFTNSSNAIFNVGNYVGDNMLVMGNLEVTGNNARPALRMNYNTGAGFLRLDTYSWDSSRWYMMGASWTAGGAAHLYLRELTGANPQTFFVSTGDAGQPLSVVNATPLSTQFLDVGGIRLAQAPYNSGPFFSNGANSPISLVALFNTSFATQADFDQLYLTYVVPEPACAALAIMLVTAFTQRRRRVK